MKFRIANLDNKTQKQKNIKTTIKQSGQRVRTERPNGIKTHTQLRLYIEKEE